ncbi:MAG: LOG family protein [Nocardioides sp.]
MSDPTTHSINAPVNDPLADDGTEGVPTSTPVNPRRTGLYSATELYADSFDARAYAWSRPTRPGRADPNATVSQALHDHAIDLALIHWLESCERDVVGVMGGHQLIRGSRDYAAAAQLGRDLSSTHVVATGGGPGAMEAANLGAYFSADPEPVFASALSAVSTAPSYARRGGTPMTSPAAASPAHEASPAPSDPWLRVALRVLEGHPHGVESLGVPTWHYGHEPTNVFATAIAKYFRNATREAVLLQICTAGIVFLPGSAGTVQEIFQDACENFYAVADKVNPMVLVGRRYWTVELPVWPLLTALAAGRVMSKHVHLVDTIGEAVDVITRQ